eukprot:19095-Heterococcus_DN1.PRE.4
MSQHTDELQLHVQQHVMYLFCETHLYVHHGRKRTLAALTNAHCNCHYSSTAVQPVSLRAVDIQLVCFTYCELMQ